MSDNANAEEGISGEVARANRLTRAMIDEYLAWPAKIVHGETRHALYSDILDFVNFRIETVDTCLLLIENRKIADSLGLSRSLLENYLLLILMCQGRKYFRLRDLADLTEGQFKSQLREEEQDLRQLQEAGQTPCLDVKRYPRAKRHIMYVFEGLANAEEPNFIIPVHFFHFQNFRPETLRLKDENYFQYDEPSPETKKAVLGHQEDAASLYRHYLSYDSLLQCLKLNELVDDAALARIEAHYTFLGKFLHPTHRAARDLHDRHNVYVDKTAIGMGQKYSDVAVLLASLYVCYIVAGLLAEAAGAIEGAPSEYVVDAGTSELRNLTDHVAADFPYFWFLFNDPPLYDRFNYCIYHATDEELAQWGGYSNVPKERVAFESSIYSHLGQTLNSWSNRRCGTYHSPLAEGS